MLGDTLRVVALEVGGKSVLGFIEVYIYTAIWTLVLIKELLELLLGGRCI
jgi:hypothetical protein